MEGRRSASTSANSRAGASGAAGMSADLRLWLRRLGLEQHAETFAANDIDLDLLSELSDADLRELGLSLGHRRRLLRAIAEKPDAEPQPPPPDDRAPTPGAGEAERRQLT